MMASRAGIIGIFAAVGFAIGFMAYLATPAVGQYLKEIWPTLMLDQSIIFAMICGGAGAAISTITVTAWAKKA
jgi:ABC-type transport system involved in cytochrome c biogenesis permease subunit